MPDYTTIDRCRVCGGTDLTPLFSLGEQLVSDFVPADRVQSGPRCPIELVLCPECSLVQQRHTAPQDFLYSRHYWYRSGVTETMRRQLFDVVEKTTNLVRPMSPSDIWLDIGANDGTLLSMCGESNLPRPIRIACEPAKNLADECRKHCDVFINDFWTADKYFLTAPRGKDESRGAFGQGGVATAAKRAKVVTALGMAYDLEDPNAFVGDIAQVLHPQGVLVFQLMCLRQMVEQCDVGNLCHEHLEFYSLKSMDRLFANHGLEIFDLESNAVNGGSYRLYIRHAGAWPRDTAAYERVVAARFEEKAMGLDRPGFYREWFAGLERNRDKMVEFVRDEVAKGKKVQVYAASTKGNVLLQWWGFDHTLIEAAAERSPEKVGRFTAGTGIPIMSEVTSRRMKPHFYLVLPYSFLGEFVRREAEWLENGGVFILPLPKPRLVSMSRLGTIEEELP